MSKEIPEKLQEEIGIRDYEGDFRKMLEGLSDREKKLAEEPPKLTQEKADRIKEILIEKGFVRCPEGPVLLGQEKGLFCTIEGSRENETPPRIYYLESFYICKNTVTNSEFEEFDSRHSRTPTSQGDKNPVTCISYGRAVSYALWLNEKTGLYFCLPTEPQLIKALAPFGWEYPYQETGKPKRGEQNVYNSFPDRYPEKLSASTMEVDDTSVNPNYLGINHATGNVSVFTFGHYIAQPGHWGSKTDGAYTIAIGGNFRLCPYSTRTVTRGIIDITGVADTVGIRLVHPDPDNYVER
jgi:hypothetical protein